MAIKEGTGYRIWFVTDSETITLPVNPLEVSTTFGADNTNYNVVGVGEVIVPRTPKLATISFESFFPKTGIFQTYVNEESWYEPKDYVSFFRELQTNRVVFKLVVCRADGFDQTFDTNFSAILNDFTIIDKGGEPGDVYYSMSVSEWRNFLPEVLEVKVNGEEDADGNTVTKRQLVPIKQRVTPTIPMSVGQQVEVTGKVYETPDQTDEVWRKTRRVLVKTTGVVGRVLPPQYASVAQRVFITDIGWVNKADCVTSNVFNIRDIIKKTTGV